MADDVHVVLSGREVGAVAAVLALLLILGIASANHSTGTSQPDGPTCSRHANTVSAGSPENWQDAYDACMSTGR